MLTTEEQKVYAERNAVIKRLGFSSYAVYLVSALWKSIRQQVLLTHTRCRGCGGKATQIHHSRYKLEDMNGKCLTHLLPVCGRCHKKIEYTRNGTKLGPQRATEKLEKLKRHGKHRGTAEAWQYFFTTVVEVRIFLGMDASEDARILTEKLDGALQALQHERHS